MNAPRAAAIPARNAEPYPRASTRTTRAPSFSAISTEPSVDPLSATTTSPRSPFARNASIAFATQIPIEFVSFKHGITTETSTPPSGTTEARREALSAFSTPMFFASATSSHTISANASFSLWLQIRNDFSVLLTCNSIFKYRYFQLAFSLAPIIMAKFRKVPETLQLPNPSDLSSTPGGSASSGAFESVTPSGRGCGRLLKVLGVWFGISAAVGNTIAAGIVRAPGDIAQWLPNVYLFFGVWVIGGLYALSGASSMAELGAAIPRSGGQYNFSRRALGDYAGFVV